MSIWNYLCDNEWVEMDGKRAPPKRPGRPAPCRWCLAENPAGTRNCGQCGKPLAALKPLRRKGP